MIRKIVVATSNQGKLKEMNALLANAGVACIAQTELGVGDAVEDGLSFVENALIKARHAATQTGLPSIADDSGLVVDALNGRPGIFSARYAGEHGNDAANNDKLLRELSGVDVAERTARFVCAAVFVATADDPCPLIAQGFWEGHVLSEARGEHGFGYDPLFLIDGDSRSSAELPAAEKNTISHRAKAINELASSLTHRLNTLN